MDRLVLELRRPQILHDAAGLAPVDHANDALRRQVSELDRKIAALVTAVECGSEIQPSPTS